MAKKNRKLISSDPNFLQEIRDMQRQRLLKGKDNFIKPTSPRRITLAMTRHPLFPRIKTDIINADLKNDKKKKQKR